MASLNEAAWKVVNEISAARREMGVDFPGELVETYEAVKALEGLLVAQRSGY
jgi:uncharacterized protein YydD (DUF2326 family)